MKASEATEISDATVNSKDLEEHMTRVYLEIHNQAKAGCKLVDIKPVLNYKVTQAMINAIIKRLVLDGYKVQFSSSYIDVKFD